MERDLIGRPQFIVSTAVDFVRSSGDALASGTDRQNFFNFYTSFVDSNYFDQYTRLINSSGNKDMLDRVGAISLDGLFVPYSTHIEHTGSLPHFESPTESGEGVVNVNSLNPFNPSNMFGTGILSTGITDSGTYNQDVWASGGHNILAAITSSKYSTDNSIESGVHPSDHYFDADFYYRKKTELLDIRSIAHRAPLILSGPGYDIDGNPVPTGADGGMHPQAYSNPALWKTGPLDVRWDQSRAVWSAGTSTKVFLSKVTNTYNPPNFSYEVERSNSRDQFTRSGPEMMRQFSSTGVIYDPEYVAYTGNPNNVGTYEQLDYTGLEFPHYEAFIIRETIDDVGQAYYNIWNEDCQDCGHVSNPCPSGDRIGGHGTASVNKKILIENPLKQNLDTGDLCFTMKTGRSKNVNTGSFVGGSGVGASGNVVTNSSGIAVFQVANGGSGYTYGGFGIINSGICASVSLSFTDGVMTTGTVSPNSGFPRSKTYSVSIYPTNATVETESLDIHWIMNSEYKTQQVVTHVACDGGLLQTCSVKIQSQGFKSCEWCGEDTALSNAF
jgi:hypothetical protein